MNYYLFLAPVLIFIAGATHLDLEWNAWMKKYEKTYTTLEEEQFRRQIWEDTRKNVLKHNMLADRGKKSYWQEVNHFADMTSEELSLYISAPPEMFHKTRSEESEEQMPPHEKKIDWKLKKCVTPAKDQKQCHSCWIFSVVAAIESRYCIKHKQLYSLSEQQIMDCGEFKKPCDPNYLESALLYIEHAQVLMKDKDYPYIGKENGSCCINMKKCVHIHNLHYKRITSEKAMATSIEKRGPIPFGMRVNTCFLRFSGKGIFDDSYCCMTGNGTHAMTIVGFGHENGLDYWLIKNSWGKKWGDDGFAKIRRNIRLCGIDDYALEVKFQ